MNGEKVLSHWMLGMNTCSVSGMPLLTPPPEGGEVLSSTARRGRWGWPRSLWAPSGRLEPLARRVRALVWFRELLLELRRPARDLEYNWRQVLTRDMGGWSCCWRFKSHFYDWVRLGCVQRWLREVRLLVAAALLEGDSSSLTPSLSTTSWGLSLGH